MSSSTAASKPARAVRLLPLFLLCVAACTQVTPAVTAPPPVTPVSDTAPGLSAPPVGGLTIPTTNPLTPTAVVTATAVSDGRWDNPTTWGGKLPATGDVVSIPRPRNVELSGKTALLDGLWVDGTLRFGDADIDLSSRYIVVSGRLQAGTELQPYNQSAQITLLGSDPTQAIAGMGTKFIGVTSGGVLKLHGQQRLAWGQLASSLAVGATGLTLTGSAATWRSGDRLAIAPGGFDPREAEVVTVGSVSGSSVSFAPPLKYAREVNVETIEGKPLEQRPSVGLLSKNIVVRGASDSDANGFGGHIMVMAGGNAQVSGVELVKLGQRGRFGRYPMHWHVAGNTSGNYLMSSSIHDSFQRAAVVHSSNNVTMDGNVAYNIPNHAFVWAEDGDETGTVMTRNLAMLIRSPEEKDFAFPINNAFFANSSQGEQRSAAFWGRSYRRHVIRGNVSAGVLDGFGYFFDLFTPAPNPSDEGDGLVFEANTAHSTYLAMAVGNQINYPEATRGHGLMVTGNTSGQYRHVFKTFTAYHNTSGAWLEDRSTKLEDSMLADNGLGVIVHRGVIGRVVIVGQSSNAVRVPKISASVAFGVRAGINVGGSNHGGKRAPIIEDAVIVNQDGAGILWDLDNISPASAINGVRFVNTATKLLINDPLKFEFADSPVFGLNDPRGRVLGDGQPVRWMKYDAATISPNCTPQLAMKAFACPASETLLLKSSTELRLIDGAGRVIDLREFGYADRGMPDDGAVSFVASGGRYEVLGGNVGRHELTLEDAGGKSVELSFAASATATRVTLGGQGVAAASSLAGLRGSSGSGYVFDGGRLYVRLTGSGAQPQPVVIEAPFTASTSPQTARAGLPASTALSAGFTSETSGGALRQERYALPPASTQRVIAADQLDAASASLALAGSGAGVTTTVRGLVYAPSDGVYRFALWGAGGGTALYIGDTWIMGQPWAFINSNFVKGGQFEAEVVPFFHPNGLVALKAGWHAFSAVHAKMPENREGNTLDLRWATPQNPALWTYPKIKRTP